MAGSNLMLARGDLGRVSLTEKYRSSRQMEFPKFQTGKVCRMVSALRLSFFFNETCSLGEVLVSCAR